MSPFSERPTSLGFPSRGGHLDRLHSNLLDLDERLREAVSQAIGQAAAGVVRQIVLSLLGPADDNPTLLRYSSPQPSRRPLWQTLDDAEERDRPPWCDEREEDPSLADRDCEPGDDLPQTGLWRQILAATLPALGWWLYRQAGRQMVGAAVGFGTVCGLALYYGDRRSSGTGLALTLLTESIAAAIALGFHEER
jgi:hypothetical protein